MTLEWKITAYCRCTRWSFRLPHLQAVRLFDCDNQFAKAAQDVVQHALFFRDAEALDPARERGEQSPHLELGEVLAEAHVRPGAEGHVTPRIVAPDIKVIGFGELLGIAIRGAIEDNCARAFWQWDTIQIIVARHIAGEPLDRRFHPEDLVNCTGYQRRISAQ